MRTRTHCTAPRCGGLEWRLEEGGGFFSYAMRKEDEGRKLKESEGYSLPSLSSKMAAVVAPTDFALFGPCS